MLGSNQVCFLDFRENILIDRLDMVYLLHSVPPINVSGYLDPVVWEELEPMWIGPRFSQIHNLRLIIVRAPCNSIAVETQRIIQEENLNILYRRSISSFGHQVIDLVNSKACMHHP